MNKLVALMLLFAVPAFAQQQTNLLPSNDVADPQPAVESARHSCAMKPALIAAGATIAAAVVVAVVVAIVQSQQKPGPLKQTDFNCKSMCDGWVNPPTQ